MGCFFVFQAFHVFFSGAEHVIVEKEHADDDASLDAAGGVDVLVSEVFTVDFDEIINETNDHSDLQPPTLIFNKSEEKSAANLVGQVKAQQQKQITIVIQPFGRSANRVDDRSSKG